MYKLLDPDGHVCLSAEKGTIGGHRGLKIFGLLNCASALRFIAAGKYVKHRVFFADMPTAMAAGYRPCGKCMAEMYETWKLHRSDWDRMVKQIRDGYAVIRKENAKAAMLAVAKRAR